MAFPTKPNANKNGCEKRLNKSAGCAGCICMYVLSFPLARQEKSQRRWLNTACFQLPFFHSSVKALSQRPSRLESKVACSPRRNAALPATVGFETINQKNTEKKRAGPLKECCFLNNSFFALAFFACGRPCPANPSFKIPSNQNPVNKIMASSEVLLGV